MPGLSLDAGDAAELAELLQFLGDWLGPDPRLLATSLTSFSGSSAYDIAQLHTDLDIFTFLLGGSDGESLFQPRQQQ